MTHAMAATQYEEDFDTAMETGSQLSAGTMYPW